MSDEVPSDEREARLARKEIASNRDLIRFSPTFSTQADSTGLGSISLDSAQVVNLGNFVLNPEPHII